MHAFILILSLILGIAQAAPAVSASDSQELEIWPQGAKVLADGNGSSEPGKPPSPPSPNEIRVPTMVVYPPKVNASRAAIIVFPGGGYKAVAVGRESTIGYNGEAVATWLNDVGVTCVVLKYRVPHSGCYWDDTAKKHVTPDVPRALQDAQRTISTIRFHAEKYKIDPAKIGVMGFSAGGNLAVLCSTAFKKRSYEPIDEIDAVSCRPDFAIPVYPGHMTMEHKNVTPKNVAATQLNTDIVVTPEIPPTLLIHAQDDKVDPVHYSMVYERELKKAGVQVQMNLYKTGGHAFGVRKSGKDTDRWTDDALVWLKAQKILNL